MSVEIKVGHHYKDGRGTTWYPHPDAQQGPIKFLMYTGPGPLTKRGTYNSDGTPENTALPDLILDLGPVEPDTSVVTQMDMSKVRGPEDDAYTPVPLSNANILADEPRPIIPGHSFPHSKYNELVKQTIDEILKLGQLKGGEYAGDNDRLANFRRNADRLGLKMEQVWAVYANKHIDAINQYVHDLSTDTTRPRLEGLAGRADDVIVYMILFKAMLIEAGVK